MYNACSLGNEGASGPPGCARGPKSQAGVEAVTGDESNLQDIEPRPDAEFPSGPLASTAARYFAAVAMTAVATIIAVGVDIKITIPNLSLVFVVPVIIA